MNRASNSDKADDDHLVGTAIQGDGRGASIGFPTANLKLKASSPIPANGIYACLAQILPHDTVYKAILHVGPRPTFEGATETVEVHILDFPNRKLYGAEIKLSFLLHIRQVKKFSSPSELTKAITQDKKTTIKLLRNIL